MVGGTDGDRILNDPARDDAQLNRERRQRKLEAIAAMERASASERLQQILELGIQEFGLGAAVVTEIVGDEAHFLTCKDTGTAIQPGVRCPANITFCKEVLTSDESVGVPDIDNSELRHHPARTVFGVESYLACRVSGSPENQTTLCFLDFKPRERPFPNEDLEFVRRLAYRVNVELIGEAREAELSMMRALFDNFRERIGM
jgi:hypothetical protein